MLAASGEIARRLGIYDSGYRLSSTMTRPGESVPHLHIHPWQENAHLAAGYTIQKL